MAATKTYLVEWTCRLCGKMQSFLKAVSDMDGWPNKFDDLKCGDDECGFSQDVPVRSCTIQEAGASSSE